MPNAFDIGKYTTDFNPVAGGPFVSIQDVMASFGDVFTEVISLFPKLLQILESVTPEQILQIVEMGLTQFLPQFLQQLFPTNGTTSPLITALVNALGGGSAGGVGNIVPQLIQIAVTIIPQVALQIEQALTNPGNLLSGFTTGGATLLQQLISAGGGNTGATNLFTEFASIFGGGGLPATFTYGLNTAVSLISQLPSVMTWPLASLGGGTLPSGVGLPLGQLTGLATGLASWLGAGGALPAGSTLDTSGLTGLATGIASWLSGGGALPGATTLGAGGLTGLATGLGSWLTGGGALPGATSLGAGQLTGLFAGLGSWLTGGGAIPTGITLPGGQLTGSVAAALISGTLAAGNIPALAISTITGLAGYLTNLTSGGVLAPGGIGAGALPSNVTSAISQITSLAGYLTNLTGGGVLAPGGIGAGALPSNVTQGIGSITGLATGLGSWLGAGGALPSATTLGAGGLTGLATGLGSWLTGGGALPSGITLPGGQLTGLATGILSWLTSGGALPSGASLPLGQLTGLATGFASWLGAGGALPSGSTLDTSGLTGLATGIGSWLTGGGALPSGSTLGAGGLTGLATGLGTWLTAGGALPAATTLGAGGLTGLATGLGSWLASGGALPGATTLGGGQLTGSVPASILSGTITETVTGINTLRDAIASGLGLAGSGFTNIQAQNQAVAVQQTANAAAAAAAQANATLAAQNAATTANNSAGGSYYNINQSGADAAALSADFGSTGPTSGDLLIRGSNSYIGIKAANGDGTYWAVGASTRQYATDNESIALVLGDQGGSTGAPLIGYFHCDSGFTVGAYVRIDNGSITIGSFTRSGSTFTYTPFTGGTYSGNVNGGNRVEVHNVGTAYTILLNGVVVKSATGSGVTLGASNRYWAVSMVRQTTSGGWFSGSQTYDAYRIAALSVADYVQPTYVGSGARITRIATATVAPAANNTANLLATNFFGVTDKNTADITVDLVNGKLTVANAGWYTLKARIKFSGGVVAGHYTLVLFRNGSIAQWGCPVGTGYDGSAVTQAPATHSSFDIYLAATDYVQLGLQFNGTGNRSALTGEATGVETYFEIALANRSLA